MRRPAAWPGTEAALAAVVFLATACAAGALLVGQFRLFTAFGMQINDYGIYTNALWNTAHGEPFRYLIDRNYIATHTSFTLALLAPAFLLWDHPFLLTLVQWLCVVGGTLLVCRIAARLGLPLLGRAALTFFFLCYPLTQSVLLCDFHGVVLYYVLCPWLYLTLRCCKAWSWAPWLLVLGLREDAGLIVLPLLLFFAVKDRWRAGYLMAGLTVLYVLLAAAVLMPALSGGTLLHRRAKELSLASILRSFSESGLLRRAEALLWLFLPGVVLGRRGWLPLLVFPSAALAMLLASGEARVHSLGVHYPAGVFPLLALGLVDALSRRAASDRPGSPVPARAMAAGLIALTVLAHNVAGRWPQDVRQRSRRILPAANPFGLHALWVASLLPKDGILAVDRRHAGFVANRRDLRLGWGEGAGGTRPDWVLIDLHARGGPASLERTLEAEGFGVRYFDHLYAIAGRREDRAQNAGVLALLSVDPSAVAVFAGGRADGWTTGRTPGAPQAAYWAGRPTGPWEGFGVSRPLKVAAGAHRAVFRLKIPPPGSVSGRLPSGSLVVRDAARGTILAEHPIPDGGAAGGAFRYEELPFEAREPLEIELSAVGGALDLWLDRAFVLPRAGAPLPRFDGAS